MKPVLLMSFAWLVLSIELVPDAIHAVPARPRYEPPEPLKPPPIIVDLRGTSWRGKDFVDDYHITFHPNGTMTYGIGKNQNHGGSWKWEGSKLYFEMNNKYREFRGTVEGNVLQGDSWNVTGKRWQVYLLREFR